jgi:hypothetical protein
MEGKSVATIVVALAALLVASVASIGVGTSELRVAHLSPDAPAVDVWLNGQVVLTKVPFGVYSKYLEIPAGVHIVQVTPTGAAKPIVIDATLSFLPDQAYTVAASGLLGADDLEAIVLIDDRAPNAEEAGVRFIHLSPDAPAVDIAVAGCGGPVLFDNAKFRESLDYIKVGEGTYDLEVRVAGTGTVALMVDDVELMAGANYTIFAKGLAGDDTLGAILLEDASLPAKLRVAHLSPDAPAVDIWVNGAVVLEDVPFKAVSDYLEVPAGEYRIQVTPTGAEEPVVIDATVELGINKAYTVAATGLLATDLAPIVLMDDLSTLSDMAKVRFVHTSPDAPSVDVGVSGGPVLFRDTEFREAGEYLKVPGGLYNLEVRLAGTMNVALPLPGVQLANGTNYTIFAIGLAGDGTLMALPTVDAEQAVMPTH